MKKMICLNMIVKNERGVIRRCLASVQDLIDYWVIVDTGSSDGTQIEIKEALKEIPGDLYERPWVNFAHNRNEALTLAKGKGDFVLFIDADEWLEISEKHLPILDRDYYATKYFHGSCQSLRVLMVDNQIDWKWEGVVHEAIDYSNASGDVLKGIVKRSSYDGNRWSAPRMKNLKDARILEEALKDEPNNSSYVLHLAGCYEAAGEYAASLTWFEKRAAMQGDPREVYFSLYRIAALQETLKMSSDIIVYSYIRAYLYRPHRLEPLYCLANYFIQMKCHFFGYLISSYAVSQHVFDDCYFTQKAIYDYGLYFQIAECSLELGKKKEALAAFKQILAAQDVPENLHQHCQKMLKLCI
jgi:glycosyltransferase involved in cell wall biosynthesis